ncbi:hypothetical protein TNCV_4589001 [Trichonephila clavipes]|nr:hypothetical protein TNCV_4589001 [Trichonephila clavipes]
MSQLDTGKSEAGKLPMECDSLHVKITGTYVNGTVNYNTESKNNTLHGVFFGGWYWARTRDKASHDPIPRLLGYRSPGEVNESCINVTQKNRKRAIGNEPSNFELWSSEEDDT